MTLSHNITELSENFLSQNLVKYLSIDMSCYNALEAIIQQCCRTFSIFDFWLSIEVLSQSHYIMELSVIFFF
jgi:hypothetical protein